MYKQLRCARTSAYTHTTCNINGNWSILLHVVQMLLFAIVVVQMLLFAIVAVQMLFCSVRPSPCLCRIEARWRY